MSDVAIRVDKLSKLYRIGGNAPHKDLRRKLVSAATWPVRGVRDLFSDQGENSNGNGAATNGDDLLWALRNVSFTINKGEIVGVIGRNGAGKSTLLKILSRITEPTSGRAEIHGRIGSLLEVGTGFHPDLTGRENIYLNGAVLGMRRQEINAKLDDIIEFSEISRFIDTPVKRYSSGMYTRLAFSVAAHLNPEIMIVDEVLSVGDASFRQKCLGKMNDVASQGRTVLFVSHNMATIQALCDRGIYMEQGQTVYDGPIETAIETYMGSLHLANTGVSLADRTDRVGGKQVRITGVQFIDAKTDQVTQVLLSGRKVNIKIDYVCHESKPIVNASISIGFFTHTGVFLISCLSEALGDTFTIKPGRGSFTCTIPKWPLNTGRYYFNLRISRFNDNLDWIKQAGEIDVEVGDFYGTGKLPGTSYQGVFIDYSWSESN